MSTIHANPKPYPLHKIFLENEKLEDVHPFIKSLASYIILKKSGKKISTKSVQKYFDRIEDWHIFVNAMKFRQINEILLSDHYMIVYKKTGRLSSIAYLFGVNADSGKLFVDIVHLYPHHFGEFQISRVAEFNDIDIKIYYTEDFRIWRNAYGYEIDFDLSEDPYAEIADAFSDPRLVRIAARIQGDLVLEIERYGLKRYYENLQADLITFVTNQIRRSIARRIANIVSNYFNVENNEVVSAIIDEKYIDDAIKFMINKIYEELDISDWIRWLEIDDDIEIEKSNDMLQLKSKDFKVKIELSHYDMSIYGDEKTSHIQILTYVDIETPPKLMKIFNEILNSIEWRPVEELHGRHRISVSNALPVTISVPIQLPDGQRLFTSELPLVARGLVRVSHPEHREKMLYLDEPVILRFANLRIDNRIVHRRNYYRIKYKYYLYS